MLRPSSLDFDGGRSLDFTMLFHVVSKLACTNVEPAMISSVLPRPYRFNGHWLNYAEEMKLRLLLSTFEYRRLSKEARFRTGIFTFSSFQDTKSAVRKGPSNFARAI